MLSNKCSPFKFRLAPVDSQKHPVIVYVTKRSDRHEAEGQSSGERNA